MSRPPVSPDVASAPLHAPPPLARPLRPHAPPLPPPDAAHPQPPHFGEVRSPSLPAARAHWPAAARDAWEERAAIMEFDAGLDRAAAEALAEVSVRARFAAGGDP
jgi:hypothetical protein